MAVVDRDLEFLNDHHSAAMITIGRDGAPKVARVGVGFVDGKLWSSGTLDRVRTARLRSDPRCTLYVHDASFSWVAIETRVKILDGPGAPADSLHFFRLVQGRPNGPLSWFGGELDEEDFLRTMAQEGRLIYEFEPLRTYGLH